jgi:putative spermidine/putrescine transport system substrate-binding protein
MIGRRSILAAGAAAGLLQATRARAAGQVIVGTFGGDYGDLLASEVDQKLLAPMGITALQDIGMPEQRKTKLIAERASKHGSMDVACLSDVDMYTVSLLNILHPITVTEVSNLVHAFPQLRTPYAIPHIYSGMVLLYNPDQVKPGLESYADLFDPKWRGRLGLVDGNYLFNIAAATLAAGGTMSDFEPGKKHLMDYRKYDPKIYPSNEDLGAALKSGEVWLTPLWLARGEQWRRAGVPITHAVPVEGAIPVTFQAAVPNNAPDFQNGLTYVNLMLAPQSQVAFAERMGYVPTVDNAVLPKDLADRIAFTETQRQRFRRPDYDYLAKNAASLLDFWNKEFKA